MTTENAGERDDARRELKQLQDTIAALRNELEESVARVGAPWPGFGHRRQQQRVVRTGQRRAAAATARCRCDED